MSTEQIIAPERQGLWIAATFVVALLGLVIAVVSMLRTQAIHEGTQIEVLALTKKIESMQQRAVQPAPTVTQAAPAK